MDRAADARGGWQARVLPLPRGTLALILLSGLLAAALLGAFGGTPSPWRLVRAAEGTLAVKSPAILRSGLFYEQRVRIDARLPVADLVIALDGSLLRDLTVNTALPAAAEEGFKDGSYRLHFGPLDAGERFELKLDGQVNPPLTAGTSGAVAWFDGERRIATLPLQIRVMP